MGSIISVVPMEGYRLVIELNNGSSITVDLSSKLKTARFAELSDKRVFNDVRTDSDNVVWGDGILKISALQLIDVVLEGM